MKYVYHIFGHIYFLPKINLEKYHTHISGFGCGYGVLEQVWWRFFVDNSAHYHHKQDLNIVNGYKDYRQQRYSSDGIKQAACYYRLKARL